MAITTSDLQLLKVGGGLLVDGAANQVFPNARVGDATAYAFIEVRNRHASLTLTSPKLWLGVDSGGGTVAVAIADNTARVLSFGYDLPDPGALSYSTPTTSGSGLALANLPASSKVLICVRRILTSATAKSPEVNSFRLSGTSPL